MGVKSVMDLINRTGTREVINISGAENLGGQGGLGPPQFLIRGAEPPKIGGCYEECNSLCWMYSE